MAKKEHGYIWYPGDILLSVRVDQLSAEYECWYRRCLDFAWLDDGLSGTFEQIASRIGKGCTKDAAEYILTTFFDVKSNGKFRSKKQEIGRKKLKKIISQKTNAGKASGRKRRERKELGIEHPFNGRSTDAEHPNLTYPNLIHKEFTNVNSERETPASETPEQDPIPAPDDNPFVREFQKTFPDTPLSEQQKALIAMRVSNSTAWQASLRFWADNGYRPKSTGKLCDYYDEEVKGEHEVKRNANTRDQPKPTSAQRIADTLAVISRYPTEAELAERQRRENSRDDLSSR